MIYLNVNCRAASVDKTSTAKIDSASHIADDWPILSCAVWGCITWWKLNNFSEKASVSFSSGLRRWRHKERPKEVASHSIRTDDTLVLYFIRAFFFTVVPCILILSKFLHQLVQMFFKRGIKIYINLLNAELNPICYLLALLGAHHFLPVSSIRVKSLTIRLLMSYIYGAPILDVSRSHTTTQHSR